ncbi:MAG: SpoVR family protein [Candidatus Hatepunaea meridiana]|nr:SpoVR family protein [Candidatus Hatepunaea meridiana]
MNNYTIKDLEKWDMRIKELVESFGLDPFPQIFELCDHHQMIGYMAYSGMPSRYPHWSFGKQYEKQKTLYDYGVAGLPYEMVINSNPCLAYLMSDNTLLLQVLTMAHVYGHNDFFRNNFNFRDTYPVYTLEKFKAHADRIRKYYEDPRIGYKKIERILDAAHTLSLNCRRNLGGVDAHDCERRGNNAVNHGAMTVGGKCAVNNGVLTASCSSCNGLSTDGSRVEVDEEDEAKRPDTDPLLFIRDHNSQLKEWERDLMTIVHEESLYFVPQMETKIMNEGWAVYWHKKILDTLDLPQDMRMEFMIRHNQVVSPIPRGLNPYHLGWKMFEDIVERWDEPSSEEREEFKRPGGEGIQKIFQVRETDRDEGFIRQYLTRELMIEMDLYQHEQAGSDRVVTKVSSNEDWKDVRNTIIRNIGMNSIPVITVQDGNYSGLGKLLLKHEVEGRELDREYAERTLGYIRRLWRQPVILETQINSKEVHIICEEEGKFEVKEI